MIESTANPLSAELPSGGVRAHPDFQLPGRRLGSPVLSSRPRKVGQELVGQDAGVVVSGPASRAKRGGGGALPLPRLALGVSTSRARLRWRGMD